MFPLAYPPRHPPLSASPSPLPPASLYCYLKVSWLARYVRRSSGLNLPVPLSPPGPSSPFLRVISSSMVISTRSAPSPPLPPTLSVFLTMVRCCCFGWAFATAWRTGWSSRLVSPPQPLPVSYFLSLRDSCFFFSEAAAFTLEGSAGGTGPCLCCDPSFFFLPCLLTLRLKTRRATRNLIR